MVTPEGYARWRASTLGALTEAVEQRAIFDLAGPLRGKRVLDIGTGDGAYAIEAAARGAIATGIDTDCRMLDAARRRGAEREVSVRFVAAAAEALPFDDASFDVILAVTVLCFLSDAARAASEMARVLAPGGRVVLGELARHSLWALERRVRAWLGDSTWSHARFWTEPELKALLAGAGLRVDDSRRAVFFPPFNEPARAIAPVDDGLSRLRVPGAAFLAVAASRDA